MERKFLDQIGLQYLWNKISLQDYPNNDTLITVLNAIDETKADKTTLEKYLTKEEYIAGESGGSISLDYLLSKEEAAEIYAQVSVLEEYLKKIEAQQTYTTLQQVYPVGSIYLSVQETNPSILFDFGTWQQIKDTFLLAAGDIYSAGSVGGEAEHTLTIDEIPSHNHSFLRHQFDRDDLDNGTDVYGANNKTLPQVNTATDFTGGGLPHNNMPPYLTVYMWQRIE